MNASPIFYWLVQVDPRLGSGLPGFSWLLQMMASSSASCGAKMTYDRVCCDYGLFLMYGNNWLMSLFITMHNPAPYPVQPLPAGRS